MSLSNKYQMIEKMTVTAQTGGAIPRAKVLDEIHVMSGHIILLSLILVCVYVSRIPDSILLKFKQLKYQILGLFLIIIVTTSYGWIHGVIATLAFVLVVSRAYRKAEAFADYSPSVFLTSDGIPIDKSHRWLNETILGENPVLIRDNDVKTSAIQDLSETSGKSSSSK
jgi:hypothetical protein